MTKKITVTVKEKILLHLMDYPREDLAPDVQPGGEIYTPMPGALSQKGIAEGVGIRWNHVPRAMKDLESKGLVERFAGTVAGEERRRAIYFLTSDGMEEARAILKRILDASVRVSDGGKVKTMTFQEVLSDLPTSVRPVDVLRDLKNPDVDVIYMDDLKVLAAPERTAIESRYISLIEGAPAPKVFFGRRDEIELINGWLEGSERMVVVTGIAGIGKTALVYKVIEQFIDRTNILWYQIHEWDTMRAILLPLADFLNHLKQKDLQRYLASTKAINLSDVFDILNTSLENIEGILVYDDYHKVASHMEPLFKLFLEVLRDKKVKMIVASRVSPTFYDRREVEVRHTIGEIRLAGLDFDASKELLLTRNINPEQVERIYKVTGGHPLALEMIKTPSDARRPSDINRFMHTEIFSKLTENARRLLGYASVFRYPLETDALFALDVPYDDIDLLIELDLIRDLPSGEIYLHDLIKEITYNRLSILERREFHLKAAEYYISKGDIESIIQAVNHRISGDDYDGACVVLADHGTNMINKGYLDELHILLNRLEDHVPTDHQYRMLLLKGDLYFAEGEWPGALECYERAVRSTSQTNYPVRAQAFRQTGHIYLEMGDFDRAFDFFQMALSMSAQGEDLAMTADTLRGIGKAHMRRGEHDRALEFFQMAADMAREAGDHTVYNEALIDIAMIYNERGLVDEAIKKCMDAIEFLESRGDKYRLCRAYNELGVAYYIAERHDDALVSWEKCIEMARETANRKRLAYALLNSASIMLKKSRHEDAINYLSEAFNILKVMDEKIGLSYVHQIYGEVYTEMGEFNEAERHFRESVKLVQTVDMPFNLAEKYYLMAMMYKRKGDLESAKKYLSNALDIYKKHGKGHLMESIQTEIEHLGSDPKN